MANCLFLRGIRAYTAKCQIRYRDPVPVGTPLRVEGRQIKEKGGFAILEGRVMRAADGAVVAEAESTFLLLGINEGAPS